MPNKEIHKELDLFVIVERRRNMKIELIEKF